MGDDKFPISHWKFSGSSCMITMDTENFFRWFVKLMKIVSLIQWSCEFIPKNLQLCSFLPTLLCAVLLNLVPSVVVSKISQMMHLLISALSFAHAILFRSPIPGMPFAFPSRLISSITFYKALSYCSILNWLFPFFISPTFVIWIIEHRETYQCFHKSRCTSSR